MPRDRGGPLRGPKSMEGGGFAAAHLQGAPRRLRGRSSGLQGAAHRAGARQPCGLPWTPETSAAPGVSSSPALRAASSHAASCRSGSVSRSMVSTRSVLPHLTAGRSDEADITVPGDIRRLPLPGRQGMSVINPLALRRRPGGRRLPLRAPGCPASRTPRQPHTPRQPRTPASPAREPGPGSGKRPRWSIAVAG